MSPALLKFAASAAFGVSATLLGFVVYQLLQSESLGGHAFREFSQRRNEKRRDAREKSAFFATFLALLAIPTAIVARLELNTLRKYVREPYTKAGYPGGLDDDEVVTLGLILAFGAGVATAFLLSVFAGLSWAVLGLVALPVGFFSLVASLQNKAEARQRQILTAMPYVLDLLVLILRAGTSLNIALARVVSDYEGHPVGEELGQVLAEIEMGAPRAEAIRRLAERLQNNDITVLADSMVQSEELGWPLADTLARQADRMAAERVLNAQAKAGAAGVWVMLPSTLVLLGAVLLLFGP